MNVSFLINMYLMTGKNKYANDAVRQILQMSKLLFDPQMGIFDHDWNAIRSTIRPNSAVDWTSEDTTFAHDNSYYYHYGHTFFADHGYGVVLYAGAEIIRLLRNSEPEILKPKDGAINSTIHFLRWSDWTHPDQVKDIETLGGSRLK